MNWISMILGLLTNQSGGGAGSGISSIIGNAIGGQKQQGQNTNKPTQPPKSRQFLDWMVQNQSQHNPSDSFTPWQPQTRSSDLFNMFMR